MVHIVYLMINNNASMIKVSFAILHRLQMHGAIFIILLRAVLLKMDTIATIFTKDIVLAMWNLIVILTNHLAKKEFIVGQTMV